MSDGPRLPAAWLRSGTPSFSDFLADQAAELLPARRLAAQGAGSVNAGDLAPHATTIVAAPIQ